MAPPLIRLETGSYSYFARVGDAYLNAATGSIIRLKAAMFPETLIFDKDIVVTLSGGCGQDFGTTSGTTVLQGSVTITKGSVTFENVTLQ